MNTPQRTDPDMRHVEALDVGSDRNINSHHNCGKVFNPTPKKIISLVGDESDIDPDDLLPEYLKTKAKLFKLQPPKSPAQINGNQVRTRVGGGALKAEQQSSNPEVAKLEKRLQWIQNDVLFDQYIANQTWEKQRILLEKEAATERNAASGEPSECIPHPAEDPEDSDDEVSREAARIGAEILNADASDDDAAIADLFASLPVTEVDPLTGKSSVVVNSNDGKKVTIRDFAKSAGISPRRVLEEACKARYGNPCQQNYFMFNLQIEILPSRYHTPYYLTLLFQIAILYASTGRRRKKIPQRALRFQMSIAYLPLSL